MMENRSFDHMLGYLSPSDYGWATLDGVKIAPEWVQRATNIYDGDVFPPFKQTDPYHCMPADPPHEYTDIARQMGHPDDNGSFP